MKTRKQGNAIVLTVPTKFGIEENVEYSAVQGEDDTITFIKKKKIFLMKHLKMMKQLMQVLVFLRIYWQERKLFNGIYY